jgi:hypothetical protein
MPSSETQLLVAHGGQSDFALLFGALPSTSYLRSKKRAAPLRGRLTIRTNTVRTY